MNLHRIRRALICSWAHRWHAHPEHLGQPTPLGTGYIARSMSRTVCNACRHWDRPTPTGRRSGPHSCDRPYLGRDRVGWPIEGKCRICGR